MSTGVKLQIKQILYRMTNFPGKQCVVCYSKLFSPIKYNKTFCKLCTLSFLTYHWKILSESFIIHNLYRKQLSNLRISVTQTSLLLIV